jgi:hypothetical protein
MEPRQPNFNEEYTTPVRSTEMVDPQQTLVHPIWRTPSGRDLYEKIILVDHSLTLHIHLPPPVQMQDHQVSLLTILSDKRSILLPLQDKLTSETRVVLPSHLQSTLTGYTYHPSSSNNFIYTTKSHWDTFTSKNAKPCHTTKPNCGTNPYWGETLFQWKIPTGGKSSGKIPTGGKPSFSGKIPTGGNLPSVDKIRLGGNPLLPEKSQLLPNL